MRVALVQLCAGDDPAANLAETLCFLNAAADAGAALILTPEVTNCISLDRARQSSILTAEADDPTLRAIREFATERKIWVSLGSLALKSGDEDGRFVNRSFLIDPQGGIVARYDKIHMFDVAVTADETFAESNAFRPGGRAVVADTEIGKIGLSICYDVRFPYLYRALAIGGAEILTVPSAFSPVTGAAHWETLLRARAIETGCFVLAAAQTGEHPATTGRQRKTWGHSLAISPWGEVLVDMGNDPGMVCIDIDLAEVAKARQRIPSLDHTRPFEGP